MTLHFKLRRNECKVHMVSYAQPHIEAPIEYSPDLEKMKDSLEDMRLRELLLIQKMVPDPPHLQECWQPALEQYLH